MHRPADRQFYSIDSTEVNKSHFNTPSATQKEQLIAYLADSVIGKNKTFNGPYGLRKVVYLDYIASGRALSFIEDYIHNEVLPEYGNTHTTTSVTSLQTTLYRHEARDIIRNAVNASEHDAVIFTGSGSTGAIHKLIHALNLTQPPVVFVGPYEHHSNLLPWKETGAEIVSIKQTDKGLVDLYHLEEELEKWSKTKRQLIGTFSAASNITGILVDVDPISILLHKYGALVFWDYATAAPYVPLDMNPVLPGQDSGLAYKDAMFISPHKFVGGVSTPGILIAKKNLFHNEVPDECGGGTVFYVRRDAHRYLRQPELREEGGTPNIVGAIRAGLVFQLKTAVTPELIMEKEKLFFRKAKEALEHVENLVILGNLDAERLPVFSFLIRHPGSGLFLHHNFISALLNDVFGIQARGGCACAGPYAMELLGLSEEKAAQIEDLLAEDSRLDRVHLRRYTEYSHREIIRPGFTRLNLPYFITEEQVDFVLQAVAFVAENAWKFLPQYMFNPETGEWRHKEQQVFKERKWLGHISYAGGHMEYSVPKVNPKGPLPESFQDCLDTARRLAGKAEKMKIRLADHTLMFDEESRPFRWFLLPSEAAQILSGASFPARNSRDLPFCPPQLRIKLEMAEATYSMGKQPSALPTKILELTDQMRSVDLTTEMLANNVTERSENDAVSENFENHEVGEDHKINAKTPANAVTENHEIENCEIGENCRINANNNNSQLQQHKAIAKDFLKTGTKVVTRQPKETEFMNSSSDSGTACTRRMCVQDQDVCCENFPQQLQTAMERGYPHTFSSPSPAPSPSSRSNPDEELEVRLEKNLSPTGQKSFSHTHSQLEKNSSPANQNSFSHTHSQLEKNSSPANQNSSSHTHSQLEKNPSPANQNSSSHTHSQLEKNPSSANQNSSNNDNAPACCSVPQRRKKKKKRGGKEKTISNDSAASENHPTKSTKKEPPVGNRWVCPPKDIFKPTVKAMEEFSMLVDGDRVMVCLSGGKDSLSLLHTMHQYQFYCRSKGVRFDLGAVTVDPQTPSYDPSPLKDYLASLGVPYFYESQCIMETAVSLPYECASICSFCSRMKRGRIYAAARRERYNVLALGQHLDDLAESFLMSLFHNGSLRTMKAHYTVQEGDLRVIRPFVYVREKDLRNFAEKNKLPVIAENCPACFEAPKERHRTKQLLASQEILFPYLYNSLLSAMKPVMAISRTNCDASTLLASAVDKDEDMDI